MITMPSNMLTQLILVELFIVIIMLSIVSYLIRDHRKTSRRNKAARFARKPESEGK